MRKQKQQNNNSQFRYSGLGFFIFFVFFILLFLTFAYQVKADCVHVWRPGLVTYVQVGQPATFIVEEEDAAAFQHQKTLPGNLMPMPSTRDEFQRDVDGVPNSAYCGEYRELADEDLD